MIRRAVKYRGWGDFGRYIESTLQEIYQSFDDSIRAVGVDHGDTWLEVYYGVRPDIVLGFASTADGFQVSCEVWRPTRAAGNEQVVAAMRQTLAERPDDNSE